MSVETEHLKRARTITSDKRPSCNDAIETGDEHVSVLLEQQKQEEQGVQADLGTAEGHSNSMARGRRQSSVTDARRAVLLSSTRKLQTTVQFMSLTRQQDDLLRQLEKVADQRNIDLLRELQDAAVRRGFHSNEAADSQREAPIRGRRPQLIGGQRPMPEISVIRKGDKGREQFIADEDTELQPGDVVEIALRLEQSTDMPAR